MAIDELLDEHEQGERVRSWLRKNGAGLCGGICVGLALIVGWQWWGRHQATALADAHARYEAVTRSIGGNDLDKAATQVATLADGGSSTYASLASLALAKAQVEAGKFDLAVKTLRGVHAEGEFGPILQRRLARLLLASGKPAEAQSLLAAADDGAALEIRADAALALGKRDQARDLYARALTRVEAASPQRRLLEVKLMDVGGTVPGPAQPIR